MFNCSGAQGSEEYIASVIVISIFIMTHIEILSDIKKFVLFVTLKVSKRRRILAFINFRKIIRFHITFIQETDFN